MLKPNETCLIRCKQIAIKKVDPEKNGFEVSQNIIF